MRTSKIDFGVRMSGKWVLGLMDHYLSPPSSVAVGAISASRGCGCCR
jgi:hypothetical protein